MEIGSQLPPVLRRRFDSIGGFVSAVVGELEERRRTPRKLRLRLEERHNITLLVFIATLRDFLREGTRAASAAANKVVELGLPGFSIGERFFAPGNENTMRGAVLADGLWARIEDIRLRNLLASEKPTFWLIEELYGITRSPERLDRYRQTTDRSE